MTAEPDLPINDAVPAPTKIEPGNLFLWNWRQMQVYAQACVAHANAAQAAEIEALRALAGCAYQMAGFHDAPVVWLDRLSQAANGEKLPGPDTLSDELLPYQPDASSEVEALRAEVDEWKDMARCASEQQDSLFREALALSARVERLAEALRLALDSHGKTLLTDPPQDAWKVNRVEEIGRALLRDQEE